MEARQLCCKHVTIEWEIIDIMARRAKIDPNQRAFDFDCATALFEERKAELLQEDIDNQPNSIQSQPYPDPLAHTACKQTLGSQSTIRTS